MAAIAAQLAERGVMLRYSSGVTQQAEAVAAAVAEQLRAAIDERGRATLALSGGRSPIPFLHALARHVLEWERVCLTLVDERWVPEDDPQSNAGLLRCHLAPVFEQLRWLPLYRGVSPLADAARADEALADWLPLDVVVLGMGVDGHTASLFPGTEGLAGWLMDDCGHCCVASRAPDGSPRLTMTGRALHSARHRLLTISGAAKLQALGAAVEAQQPEAWPIAAFVDAPMDIYYCPEDGRLNDVTA